MERENTRAKVASICLAAVGVGILVFGVIAALAPSSGDERLMRADGAAATGMGLFGVLIALIPFRRRERWAWLVLWYYPVFWGAHLVGGLPPARTTPTRWCSSPCRSPGCFALSASSSCGR